MSVAPPGDHRAGGRPLVVLADGPDGPLPDPRGLTPVAGLAAPETVIGWVVRDPGWLDAGGPVSTLLIGPGTRSAVRAGSVRSLPTRLSAVPGLLAGRLRPAVAVVSGVADRSGFRFAPNLGWAPDAARHAGAVVVEVVDPGPGLRGARCPTPGIEGPVVEVVERADPPDPPPTPVIGDAERRIGELVAGLVPGEATIQWGPGTIGAAVVQALRTPVRVRSGLVTDELVALVRRGLLVDEAEAAYLWGGEELTGLVAAGRLRMRPVSHTHDLSALSAIPRLVAINTALEVGLDGAVNVEGPPARPVAGPGGHPDFCVGASRSPGGISIIALRATYAGRSAIVEQPEVVSTGHCDVDIVVTEHGVADLRGLGSGERAVALAGVANPEDKDALRRGPHRTDG